MARTDALTALLTELYTPDQAFRMVSTLEDSGPLLSELPATGTPTSQYMHELSNLLLRFGMIDDQLWSAMIQSRPRLRNRIESVAAHISAASQASPPTPDDANATSRIGQVVNNYGVIGQQVNIQGAVFGNRGKAK